MVLWARPLRFILARTFDQNHRRLALVRSSGKCVE